MLISEAYPSLLFPGFPNEIGEKIIQNLSENSLYKLSETCKKVNNYITHNRQTLFSSRALKLQFVYKNIVEIFGSMEKYKELPKFKTSYDAWEGIVTCSNMYSRHKDKDEFYVVYTERIYPDTDESNNFFWIPLSGFSAVKDCRKVFSYYFFKLMKFYFPYT